MRGFFILGLLVLLASTFSASPVETERHLNNDESQYEDDLVREHIADDGFISDEDADIDIIPLEDILGLVTPDGEIVTDPELTSEISGYSVGKRRKRWVPLAIGLAVRGGSAAYRAYRGWKAARTVRRGTQASPFKSGMRVKQYERSGNFRDAFQTFKSVKPTDVKRFSKNGVRGVTGRVGDRTITVRNKSDSGRPTVELFKTNVKKSDRITDKIRYND